MRYMYLAMVLLMVSACGSTTVPVHASFPEAPPSLMEPPPALVPLPSDRQVQLSDILENASTNYGHYHALASRLEDWQRWYREQRRIFESIQ